MNIPIEILIDVVVILLTIFIVVSKPIYDLRDKRYKSYFDSLKKGGYQLLIIAIALTIINCILLCNKFINQIELDKLNSSIAQTEGANSVNLEATRPNIYFQKNSMEWLIDKTNLKDNIKFCYYNSGCRMPIITDFKIKLVEIDKDLNPISIGEDKGAFAMWKEQMNPEIPYEQFCFTTTSFQNDYQRSFYKDSLQLILQTKITYQDKISSKTHTAIENYHTYNNQSKFKFGIPIELITKYSIKNEKMDIDKMFK